MTPKEQAERFKTVTDQIERASKEGASIICLGDWNLDLLKMDDENYRLKKAANELKTCISNFGMKVLDFGITFQRVHQDGKKIQSALDYIVMNKPEQVNDYFKIDITYSDHSGIILDTHIGISKHSE